MGLARSRPSPSVRGRPGPPPKSTVPGITLDNVRPPSADPPPEAPPKTAPEEPPPSTGRVTIDDPPPAAAPPKTDKSAQDDDDPPAPPPSVKKTPSSPKYCVSDATPGTQLGPRIRGRAGVQEDAHGRFQGLRRRRREARAGPCRQDPRRAGGGIGREGRLVSRDGGPAWIARGGRDPLQPAQGRRTGLLGHGV